MSPKKKLGKYNASCSSNCNCTENEVDPLVTDSETSNFLRQELKAAINTMGPDTPKKDDFNSEQVTEEIEKDIDRLTVYPIECERKKPEIQEIYKNDLNPSICETETEVGSVLPSTSTSLNDKNDRVFCTNQLNNKNNNIPKTYGEIKGFKKCTCPFENYVKRNSDLMKPYRRTSRLDRNSITKWFKNKTAFAKNKSNDDKSPQNIEYYKMFVSEAEDDHSPPRRLVFNLVEELPKPECASVGVNTKDFHIFEIDEYYKSKEIKDHKNRLAKSQDEENSVREYHTINKRNENVQHKIKPCDLGYPARVDVYYFDHGNASYLRTTDNPPLIRSEIVANQSEECNIKFWGEIFGTFHIGTSFVTSFITQSVRFILQSILRPLTIGLLQISSDYFFKPLLTTLFNAVIQPPLIFIYNICTSLRDICDPIAEGIGYFLREISYIFKACRLIDYRNSKSCCERSCTNNKNSPCVHGEDKTNII